MRGENTTLAVWAYLDRLWTAHEPMPTVREVQAELGLSSSSVAEYHMLKLERAHVIEWKDHRARCIKVLKAFNND